ncbi:MAG: aromatic ring-hydroxylating dioxygenase subunit alpha [Sphingomicrobium sp.]
MEAYVRNLWYMAAWAEEVPDAGSMVRTLLDESWLLLRLEDGNYAMLRNKCPHRLAPLSRGKREGDVIFCGYHGLGFDALGQCVHNAFGSQIPPGAKVSTMPIVERHSALWFWPGDKIMADPALIPDFSFVEGPAPHQRAHLTMQANYELVTDNLMDLSHAEFLHVKTFGVNGSLFGGKHSVKRDHTGAVWNNWDIDQSKPPEWSKPMLDGATTVDQWLHMRWHAPASMALSIGIAKSGTSREELIVPPMLNPHIITPETGRSSHYFYTSDPGEEAAELARRVFIEEDEPMIEAIQQALGDHDLWAANPISMPSDAGAIRARRELTKMRQAASAALAE